MEKKNYSHHFISPSATNGSGLKAMAKKLVEEARKEYADKVYATDTMPQIVEKLKTRVQELKKENPRWGEAEISYTKNDWTGHGFLNIDSWSFICYGVRAIVDSLDTKNGGRMAAAEHVEDPDTVAKRHSERQIAATADEMMKNNNNP